MIPEGVNAAPGAWSLAIDDDSLVFTHPDGREFSPGEVLEITADGVVLAPDPQCMTQDGTPAEGRYRWTVDGETLRFEEISDSCRDRADTLTSAEWARRP